MENTVSLMEYEEWKHCIVVRCRITLTRDFIDKRLAELVDKKHEKTIQFERLYGTRYKERIVNHFKRARLELKEKLT